MEIVSLPDVFRLPIEDRLRLVHAIWDSVAEHPEEIRLSDNQRSELDQCYSEYLAEPEEGSPWPEVKARLLSRE